MGFGGLGMWEIILIFLVVLLLFGAKRLPEIGSSLGKGIREFKGSLREIEREINTPSEKESISSGKSTSEAPIGADREREPVREREEESDGSGEPRRLTTEG